ncbi:MAG TPA: hypothetical protein VIF40_02630 [Methylosinus sp.]|jgi:tetratricopeptide (TPR) repeat protein|uniref:hypothetical protein n=1 Tax=Methylosinus sp. TaxID=427 RepID=UPI002F941E4E
MRGVLPISLFPLRSKSTASRRDSASARNPTERSRSIDRIGALLVILLLLAPPRVIAEEICDATAIGGGAAASASGTVDTPLVSGDRLRSLLAARGDRPDGLDDAQKHLLSALESKLRLDRRQLAAGLDILAETDIPTERLSVRLAEVAQQFASLRERLLPQEGDDAALAARKSRAAPLAEAGDLNAADALFAAPAPTMPPAGAAAARALRGEIAMTRLRNLEAADHFAAAAALAEQSGDTERQMRVFYLFREAAAWYRQGAERKDASALKAAAEKWTVLLPLAQRQRAPLYWAEMQSAIGDALVRLGDLENENPRRYAEAAAAYRESLKERTRERAPLDRAITQSKLGVALAQLGRAQNVTRPSEEAVAALRDALSEKALTQAPAIWAKTHTNLGVSLELLGTKEQGTRRFDEAIAAYRAALTVYKRECTPLDWAGTQHNMANSLRERGKREQGKRNLEAAVAAYREASKERMRERQPREWVDLQNDLGVTLMDLGARERETRRLEESITTFREALHDQSRDANPRAWAMAQSNFGNALGILAEREKKGTQRLAEAVGAYREALRIFSRESAPVEWVITRNNLGVTLLGLGAREKKTSHVEEAIAVFRQTLDGTIKGVSPFHYENARHTLERAVRLRAKLRADAAAR